MARESAISKWLDSGIGTESEFKSRWSAGGETREGLWKEIGYANEGACYNAARNASIIAGGPAKTGSNNGDGDGDKVRTKRVKGCLPVEVERWVRSGMMADWVYAGNSTDDYEEPGEITAEMFLNHRPVKDETTAYRKILARIGGIDGDAGKALRAWAGRPLTKAQALSERGPAKSIQDRATAANMIQLAQHATPEFRTVILAMLANEFGDEWFDRKVGDGFIAIS
jgi:hypothetical protein